MTPTAAVLLSGSGIGLESAARTDTWRVRPAERLRPDRRGPVGYGARVSQAPAEFEGFPVAALDFFDDLEVDNTQSFWEEHKGACRTR